MKAGPGALAFTAMTTLGLLVPAAVAAHASPNVTVIAHFVVTNDSDVSGDSAYIDNHATDNRPRDIVFMTFNETPGGVGGRVFVFAPMGVRYDSKKQKWAAFTEDKSSMPKGPGPSFNILVVPKATKSAFVLRSTASNSSSDHVFINSRLLNGKPHASIQVTPDYNPGGTRAGKYNPHPVGVRYFPAKKRWAVYNTDGAAMPAGAAFNVLIGTASSNGGKTGVAKMTVWDYINGFVLIKNPNSNGNPKNVTFVTNVFNPGGKGGCRNKHPLEVDYPGSGSGSANEAINNSDQTQPPIGCAFNVLVYSR